MKTGWLRQHERFDIIIFIAVMVLMLSLGLIVGNLDDMNVSFNIQNNIKILPENFTQCGNLSLKLTSECLRDYVNTFYNYTIRNDTIKTFDDIKQNGGDCFDYSNLYKNHLEALGFNASVEYLYGEEWEHAYTIAWNNKKEGYCKLDLLSVECIEFAV